MKRSEVNRMITEAKAFFKKHCFQLPPWAFWSPSDWKGRGEDCREIVDCMLGWDITDFGSSDFDQCGLMLFTIRNGNAAKGFNKVYAEKIMIVRENQETPFHFHWKKMEDIINRGGGNLVLELFGSTPDEELHDQPVTVTTDGVTRQVEPGGKVVLTPGESICLVQGLYHRFYGEEGKGLVLVGEVSECNDDTSDNRFYKPVGRFPDIEEDEAPLHLLCNEYARYL
jgi:D-lyxose ketol-isomerase